VDRVRPRLDSALRALRTLEEVLAMPYGVVVRDAAIQRFEYTFEASWKALQSYLRAVEGVSAGSPNGAFREALKVGLIAPPDVEALLRMTDDRNLTANTYMAAIAERIFGRLPDHLAVLDRLLSAIAARLTPPAA
jgi:nucleotidyltransferase substrate binding protein (TIGR01987 family)